MKKYLIPVLFLLSIEPALSALAPQYRNVRDLDVLVAYVHSHPRVASRLHLIDMRRFSIMYGAGCVVTFKRKKIIRLPGWVGPAAPLVFSRTTCAED